MRAEDTFRETMSSLIAERWAAVWEAIPVAIESPDPSSVHDVRVASRRLRAAMEVSADAFPSNWYKPLHRVAKEITSELGEVRDRDVLLEFLDQELQSASIEEQPGLERMIHHISEERETSRAEMIQYLRSLATGGIAEETAKRFGISPEVIASVEEIES